MTKLIRVLKIHPNYKSRQQEISNCIEQFNVKGNSILEGSRNAIKSFNLATETINIKSFKKPNGFNGFVYKFIRKSKAKRSFQNAQHLLNLGILTPFPVAYIEEFSPLGLKNSYYVSNQIDYDLDFRVLIHNPKYPDRENILRQFTAFTFNLHENNINFLDHSPGNTLIIKKDKGKYDFYLIDLNRMVFEPMGIKKRMFNFRRLWLSKTMIKIIAQSYSQLYQSSYDEIHNLMLKYSKEFQGKINRKKLKRAR